MGAVCHPVLLLAGPCTAAQLLQGHTIRQAVVEQGAGSCVGWGDGLGAGWGSLQPHCTCRNTGRLGVLPLWDVPQCAHGVRGSGVQSCPCTLRPCSCVCPVWLHQRHRGHPEPQQPRQQLWSCDPHRAGTGQPEWDGQGGCTQARRDGKLPTPSRFLPSAGQET